MAKPVNPLDIFVTYICHYELYLSDSWDELDLIKSFDINDQTTAKACKGPLVINTRKDAHQHIDNIKYMYVGPLVDPSGNMQCVGELSLDIIEPNGTSFIEKLTNRIKELKITDWNTAAQFGLKIFFVGRTADGGIETIPFKGMIPLHLMDFSAKYSEKGGEYHLSMVITSNAAGSTPLQPQNGIARTMGFVNKNTSFKAGTVQEAMQLLEDKLNKNYKDVYSTELLNSIGAKELRYKIELDPKITGSINLITKDSLAPGEKCQLTFTPSVDIGTMVKQILMSSKDVNVMIGESKDGLSKEGHPGVKLPIIQSFYHLTHNVVNLITRISLYEGSDEDVFEFDYYFSGKNVDVLSFEVKFNRMAAWLSGSLNSTNLNRSPNADVATIDPNYHASNIVPEDRTCSRINYPPEDKKEIPGQSRDTAHLPVVPRSEVTGMAKYQVDTVPMARLAFETYGAAIGSTNNQVTFTIRGHLNILEKVVYTPDGKSLPPPGIEKPTWIKVNIFDQEGNQFFYTGKYQLMSVENLFQGGKFHQNIFVIMMNDTASQSNANPTVAPNTNTRRGQ